MTKGDLEEYAECLSGFEYMSFMDDGIQRLSRIVSWPDGKLPEQVRDIFPAFCEYVAFNVGTKIPFFEAVCLYAEGREDQLFSYLLGKKFTTSILSYDEAFEFLLMLNTKEVRSILEAYGKFPSNAFNGILEACSEVDYDLFKESVKSGDYTDFFSTLYLLRFILIGQYKGRLTHEYHHQEWSKCSEWLRTGDYGAFFLNYVSEDDFYGKMIENVFAQIIGIDGAVSFSDYATPRPVKSALNSELISDKIMSPLQCYYSGFLTEWSQDIQDGNALLEKTNKVVREAKGILQECQSWGAEILEMPVYTHPKAAVDYINEHTEWGVDKSLPLGNTLKILSPYFIYRSNRKDRNQRREHLNQAEIKERVAEFLNDGGIASFKQKASWTSYDKQTIGDYILLHIYWMAEVYNYLSEFIDEEVKNCLMWIIEKSPYRVIAHFLIGDAELEDSAEPNQSKESDNEVNSSYPSILQDRKRLHSKTLQDILCKKRLFQWFQNGINDVPYIKYVFFGRGKEPKEKLVYIGEKKDLVLFVLFLNGGKGKQKVWDYFTESINDKFGKPVFASNPISYAKGENTPPMDKDQPNYEERIRIQIREFVTGRELTKEEEEDIK